MKRFMLLLVSLLLLGTFTAAVSASPIADLTALASYFPDGSVMYMGVSTDDDFIATLDSLADRIGGALPTGGIPSVSQSLDMLASGIKQDATFQELFRSWLGDTAAFGMLPMTTTDQFGNPVALIVVSITDREAAEAFFLSVTSASDYEQTAGDDFTAYENTRGNTHVLFRDDVAIIASDFAAIEDGGVVDAPLNADADFTNTLALLPESDYNGVLYVDMPTLWEFVADMNASMGGSMGASEQFMIDMLQGVEPYALGLTFLDENSLTIDVATATNVEAMGMPASTMTPLDLSFVQRIPAGTPLVVLGTNFADSLSYSRELLSQFSEMQGMNFANGADDVALAFWIVEFGVRGFTAMNLEDEILPAINGTYAMYLGVNPAAENIDSIADAQPQDIFDFALAFQVTDAAVAAQLRENLSATLHDLPAMRQDNLDVSFEDINGTEVVVLDVVTNSFRNERMEVLLAVSDEVFVVGTRRYVEAALNPDVGLDQDPQWQEAQQYVVPDAYALLYQSSDNLVTLGNLFSNTPGRSFSETGMGLLILTDLVSSSSISYGRIEDGGVWMRAVVTLDE